MREPTPDRDHLDPTVQTANDHLKAQWDARVAWAIMAASVVHAAAFALSPEWTRQRAAFDPDEERTELEWVFLYENASPSLGAPQPAPAVGAELDSIPSELDPGLSLSDAEAAELADALRARILRRGPVLPTMAEREPEGASDDPADRGTGARTVGADPKTAEYPSAEALSALDLERLSALRPEVTIQATSSWLMLRNPDEVNAFVVRRAARGELSAVASGSVSVVLWVSETGAVEWAEISRSSGRSDLDETTLELVSEVASFWPARRGGVPEPASLILTVVYPWF